MRLFISIVIIAFVLSCSSNARIGKDEITDMQEQIDYLNKKVDSLETLLSLNEGLVDMLVHDSLLFSLRQTACFGNCPVYTFKVYKDGWATYDGSNYVDLLGVYTAQLTNAEMKDVERIFREARFYTFKNEYDDSRQDIPAMIVEYHGDHGVKKVVARTSIPHSFRTMVVDLQELSDAITWKPVD